MTRPVVHRWWFRLGAIAVGVVGAVVWIGFDDDPGPVTATTEQGVSTGQVLTPAERLASDDCAPMDTFKRHHHGYPPPWVVVTSADHEDREPWRMRFDPAWDLTKQGRVWIHLACDHERNSS